ncbi:hypothetical protein [Cerasicoccus fimbriatus]|uniref:hypothetical protein n=1 Tax=Cerasicoccus fimbriatus TaxID=3014554 RepID=UPI0022B48F01|nr:hypothetical protein [Cerasicoccus sp. TK19100]
MKENIADMISGPKLRDSLDKLKERVGPTTLILVDTLHRYDFAERQSDDAEAFARSLGDKWLAENADYIGNTPVCRWDDILGMPAFPAYLQLVNEMDSQDERFHACLDSDIARYFTNRAASEDVVNASRRFIKEEIAGFLAFAEGQSLAYFYHGSFMQSVLYADSKLSMNTAECPIRCKRLKEPYPIPDRQMQRLPIPRRQNER